MQTSPWLRALAIAVGIGSVVALALVLILAIGIPNYDELLVISPVILLELLIGYSVVLAILYMPIAALLRATGMLQLARWSGYLLWPVSALGIYLVTVIRHPERQLSLVEFAARLARDWDRSVPLLCGLAVAGVVFMRSISRVRTS